MRDDDGRKLDHKTLEQLRLRAVGQIEQGAHPDGVAAGLGMTRAAVYGWLAKYRELVNDLDQPLARLDQAAGLEDAADGRGDHGLLGLADMAEHVAEEMDGAPLPRAAKHLGDRLLEALVGVGDAQPDARQPAGAQAAQELAPERLGLGLTDVDADDLPAAGLVNAVGGHQRLVAHPLSE